MHITNLRASNLKGSTFQHELTKAVLITGPNFSGKTTRLAAIRFALLGHEPELGKQNQATFDLSSGSVMSVGLTFDTGDSLTRSLSLGKSISADVQSTLALPERMPLLDPSEYFALSDSERVQYVFNMMKMPDAFSVEAIVADLRNLKLETDTEQTEKARAEIITTVQATLKQYATIPLGLGVLTKDKGVLKSAFSYNNQRAKDTQGTLRVLSELKTRAGECSAETIQGLDAQLRRLEAELAEANRVSGQLSQRKMSANGVELRRTQLEEALAEKPSTVVDDAALKREMAAARKAIVVAVTEESVEDLRDKHSHAQEAANELSESILALEEAKTNLETAKKCKCKGACPCHSAAGTVASINAEIKKSKAKLTKLEKIENAAHVAWKDALKTLGANHDESRKITELTRKIARAESSVSAEKARRDQMKQELARLTSDAPTDQELQDAASAVMRLQTQVTEKRQAHTAAVKLQQDLIRASEAAEEHEIAAAKVEVIKAIGASLKEKQADMVRVLFTDLLQIANWFTAGIMVEPLAFHEGEVGYFKEGRFVSHKTFSGTERTLTYIAIAAALMKDAPFRIVLLDEFDIDAAVFPRVLDRLFAATTRDGYLDQVVIAHTVAPANDDGYTHISL